MEQKVQKKAFVFEIMASELVALMSSVVNVLTNSYKALRLTKTDFFRLNYVPNDQ